MSEPPSEFTCPNCGSPYSGPFCYSCGQKKFNRENFSFRHFVLDSLREHLNIDNKLFRSIVPLIFKPGFLTREYIEGRQKRFVKPLSLFIFINLFFFLFGYQMGLLKWKADGIATATEREMIRQKTEQSSLPAEETKKAINERLSQYQRSMFFAVIPLFAVVLQLLFWKPRRFYAELLVYSIHFFSAFLIVLPLGVIVLIIIVEAFQSVNGSRFLLKDAFLVYYASALIFGYHVTAFRKVFHEAWASAVVKGAVASVISILLITFVAQRVLLWLVLKTM